MREQAGSVICLYFANSVARDASVFINAVAEACLSLTPQVAVRAPDAVFLEVGRSLQMLHPRTLMKRLQVIGQTFVKGNKETLSPEEGLRLAWADSAAKALAMARFQAVHGDELPLEALHEFADPFGISRVERKQVAEIVRLLRQLGLRSVGDFTRLPADTLPAHVGKVAFDLYQEATGNAQHAWPRWTPPDVMRERVNVCWLDDGSACVDAENLFFFFKRASDRLFLRLRGRCERMSAVDVRLFLEDHSQRVLRLELPMPQTGSLGFMPILREVLDATWQREPLLAAPVSIELTVLETVPGSGSQRDLFLRLEEEREAWEALVGRLQTRLGRSAAFVADLGQRYRPEEAWSRQPPVLPIPRGGAPVSDVVKRPLRLLPVPQALIRQGDFLNAPASCVSWRIARWQGPERLGGEWWMPDGGFGRDYFRVATEGGEELWIYSALDGSGLFLHGYFD